MKQDYEGKALRIKGITITPVSMQNFAEQARAALQRFADGDWGTQDTAAANDTYIAQRLNGRDLMARYQMGDGLTIIINARTLRPDTTSKMEVSQLIIGALSDITSRELNLATGTHEEPARR